MEKNKETTSAVVDVDALMEQLEERPDPPARDDLLPEQGESPIDVESSSPQRDNDPSLSEQDEEFARQIQEDEEVKPFNNNLACKIKRRKGGGRRAVAAVIPGAVPTTEAYSSVAPPSVSYGYSSVASPSVFQARQQRKGNKFVADPLFDSSRRAEDEDATESMEGSGEDRTNLPPSHVLVSAQLVPDDQSTLTPYPQPINTGTQVAVLSEAQLLTPAHKRLIRLMVGCSILIVGVCVAAVVVVTFMKGSDSKVEGAIVTPDTTFTTAPTSFQSSESGGNSKDETTPENPPAVEAPSTNDSASPSEAPGHSIEPSETPPTDAPTASIITNDTTNAPTIAPTNAPTSLSPTTISPSTISPNTEAPTTANPTTAPPTSANPTTASPTTPSPTTKTPTGATTRSPTHPPTPSPTTTPTSAPTRSPTKPPTPTPTTRPPSPHPTNSPTKKPDEFFLLDSNAGRDGEPESAFPLQVCQADCDEDGDCADGLVCLQRSESQDPTPDYCTGEPQGSEDYCVLQGPPTPKPTLGPTRQIECDGDEQQFEMIDDEDNNDYSEHWLYATAEAVRVRAWEKTTWIRCGELLQDKSTGQCLTVFCCGDETTSRQEDVKLAPCDPDNRSQKWELKKTQNVGTINHIGFFGGGVTQIIESGEYYYQIYNEEEDCCVGVDVLHGKTSGFGQDIDCLHDCDTSDVHQLWTLHD